MFKSLAKRDEDGKTIAAHEFLDLYRVMELDWWLDPEARRPVPQFTWRQFMKSMVNHTLYEVFIQATVVANSVYLMGLAIDKHSAEDGTILNANVTLVSTPTSCAN